MKFVLGLLIGIFVVPGLANWYVTSGRMPVAHFATGGGKQGACERHGLDEENAGPY